MTHFERRFDPQKRDTLHNMKREAKWQPRRMLQHLGIQRGQSVLDLGCGTGFWTIPLAEIIGESGIVWALDVSQEMLDTLAERKPPTQVRLLLSELPHIDLPDLSVDWIWGAFVIHEVELMENLIIEMRRVLRGSGHLAILEWRPDAAHDDGPPNHHRLAPTTVSHLLKTVGFEILPQNWNHEDAYLIEACLREKR